MTDIRKLMEEATMLPWPNQTALIHRYCEYSKSDDALATVAVNALPAVLKYMKGGHFGGCPKNAFSNRRCTCGYDNLRKALGVDGE